jgi:phosphatidylserine/phosphatidylglycerophosphate/cardiolipin synthase-like enzyme
MAFLAGCSAALQPPAGTAFRGPLRDGSAARFLADTTYRDRSGTRHSDQEIFDRFFALIAGARRFVLVDMFLFNDFQGPVPETTRALSAEFTAALLAAKRRHPAMRVAVITDPVNTVYGGTVSPHFEALRAGGVEVVVTDLAKLRDSNPSWSGFWRAFIAPLGNEPGGVLPGPFTHDRVTLRSYLSFLNFKANHRKTLVADRGNGLAAMVLSGNTHDGSSAHSNIAVELDGAAAHDLLATENAVLAMSGAEPFAVAAPPPRRPGAVSLAVMTESAVRDDALAALGALGAGDRLDVALFYLSHRPAIAAMRDALRRGVAIRLLLDPNRNAFGLKRNGIPNAPVAAELMRAGAQVRWCEPHGGQCHSKFLMARRKDGSAWMSAGTTNFTRRNLDDFNLETNVVLRGPAGARPFREAAQWFDAVWTNRGGRLHSREYAAYADESPAKRALYRFMEASGWSTF